MNANFSTKLIFMPAQLEFFHSFWHYVKFVEEISLFLFRASYVSLIQSSEYSHNNLVANLNSWPQAKECMIMLETFHCREMLSWRKCWLPGKYAYSLWVIHIILLIILWFKIWQHISLHKLVTCLKARYHIHMQIGQHILANALLLHIIKVHFQLLRLLDNTHHDKFKFCIILHTKKKC